MLRDMIAPIHREDNAPKFTVTLANGENVILDSGSIFPSNALDTTSLLVVATKISGQSSPVLCETTWDGLKDLINLTATKSESELLDKLYAVYGSVSMTTPEQASQNEEQFSDYLADLTIMLVIMRQLKGIKIAVISGNDKDLLRANLPLAHCSMLWI